MSKGFCGHFELPFSEKTGIIMVVCVYFLAFYNYLLYRMRQKFVLLKATSNC